VTAPLTYTLTAVDELIADTGVPIDRAEATELLAAVHAFGDTLDVLHDDLAECLAPLDNTGRCTDCGRLVARAHDRRGCAMLIPVVGQVLWLLDNAYSIPFLGKALWLHRRRQVMAKTSVEDRA
jgi:hypothetical protein